jgi:8-amino-3,8-dideoxy-alpha-D-manno-octulosonate transaminase
VSNARLTLFELRLCRFLEELARVAKPLFLGETGFPSAVGYHIERECLVVLESDNARYGRLMIEFVNLLRRVDTDYEGRMRAIHFYEWRDNLYHSKIWNVEQSPIHVTFGLCDRFGVPKFDIEQLTGEQNMSSPPFENEMLAICGGEPAKRRPDPPMYPGGMMIDQEEEQAVLEVLRSKGLYRYYARRQGSSKADELEQAFAAHMGTRHALAVTSGTAALVCGLQGIGVGPGDEVIVPGYTWMASPGAVVAVGGVPVLAEVDETLTLDPIDVEAKITPYTKAIMPVHMRGVPCHMDELMDIAQRFGLKVIEDAAQSDGGSYKGRRLGSIGDVGCFSLQFNKIITAGEGGMVITNDDEVWKRALMFHDPIGGLRNNFSSDETIWGINFRMPELLAAVALVQLSRLEGLLEAMRVRKRMLKVGIKDTAQRKGITLQQITDAEGDAAVSFIFFVDSAATARQVSEALVAENINATVLYRPDRLDYHVYPHWVPIMNQSTWTQMGGPWRWAKREVKYHPDDCPRTLDLLGRAVHLDVSPLLTNEDLEETVEGVNKVLNALM